MIGGIDMSLVQLIITDKFILIGGDKRVVDKDYNILTENANKVVRLNKFTIVGFTGRLRDCYDFFKDYCDFSPEIGLSCKPNNCSYNEIITDLCKKYQLMCQIHNNKTMTEKFDIGIVVAGYDGSRFLNYSFNLHPYRTEWDGVIREKKATNKSCLSIVLGGDKTDIHYENLQSQINQLNPTTILQYKNIMKDVFDKGAVIDKTINNNYSFEKIRVSDVI